MKTKHLLLPIACMSAALGLFSCEKNSGSEVNPTPDAMAKQDVVLRDGVLVFKDRKTMKDFNSYLNAKGVGYANQWEKSLGFESMAHVLNDVRDAENKLEADFVKGKSADELANLKKQPAPHSALYTKWVNAGTLRVTKDADGAEELDVNASHTLFTNVLNSEGLVAFGDTVYQFKGRLIKTTTKGLSHLAALRSATQTDPSRHISVQETLFPDEQRARALQTAGTAARIVYSGPIQESQTQYKVGGTSRKITTKVSFYSNLQDIQGDPYRFVSNDVDFWYEGKAEYKNTWGNWKLQENGKGISGFTAQYGWDARVKGSAVVTLSPTFDIPGYTAGAANPDHSYLATSKPNVVRFDYTTGAPQFGNQVAPNGRYDYSYFSQYIDTNAYPNWSIIDGLMLRRDSYFAAYADGQTAAVTWTY